jgi:hypothetical protein
MLALNVRGFRIDVVICVTGRSHAVWARRLPSHGTEVWASVGAGASGLALLLMVGGRFKRGRRAIHAGDGGM